MSATEYNRAYYYKRRAKLIRFLGGKCTICASVDNLQIDHIDPSQKTFDITRRLSLKNPSTQSELQKCQLLCRSCHEQKTGQENSGFTHGTQYGWMKAKCPCTLCIDAKHTFYDIRNTKRRTGSRGPYKTKRSG